MKLLHISSRVTACTVAFGQPNFDVDEDSGQASIEVVACNSLPANFDIMITTMEGSATGELI